MFGLDYSSARPGSAALLTAGVTSVGRYLGTDGRCITMPELTDYLTHGINVWFIKENAANGMLNGYGQGVSDATAAQTQLNTLNQETAVVYFTADFDAQPYQFAALDAYLHGVAAVIPVPRIGLYAGIDYLNYSANIVNYRWKTASSSFDHGQTAAVTIHIIQTLDAVPIPNTDYNVIVEANHGQTGTTATAGTGGSVPINTTTKARNMIIYSTGTGWYLTENGHSVEINDATIRGQQITQALSVDVIQRIAYRNTDGKMVVNVEEAAIFQYWVAQLN